VPDARARESASCGSNGSTMRERRRLPRMERSTAVKVRNTEHHRCGKWHAPLEPIEYAMRQVSFGGQRRHEDSRSRLASVFDSMSKILAGKRAEIEVAALDLVTRSKRNGRL